MARVYQAPPRWNFLWINWPDKEDLVKDVIRGVCVDCQIREYLYETQD